MNKWSILYRVGAISAIIIVSFIPVQMFLFIVYPPPDNAQGYFTLFQNNWFLGLLHLDLLYIIENTLLAFIYLALYTALRRVNESLLLIALTLGLIGIITYYSSTVAFEMLSLSKQYSIANTTESKSQCLASGQALLAIYKGTAFDVYYVLSAFSLLIFSSVMLQGKTFSKATAIWGIIAGILMLLPTTAGTIGLTMGSISLIPWTLFSILIASRFFKLARQHVRQ